MDNLNRNNDERSALAIYRMNVADPLCSVGVALAKTFAQLIERANDTSALGLIEMLKEASNHIKENHSLSVACACDMTFNLITLFNRAQTSESDIKSLMLQHSLKLAKQFDCREHIAAFVEPFIPEDATVLIHGCSRVVMTSLEFAADKQKRFNVLITNCSSDPNISKVKSMLNRKSIAFKDIDDCAVAFHMNKVDLVLFGAEIVAENGGIVNKSGSLQIAIVAKEFKVPVYVAAESYKFSRRYLFQQSDVLSHSLNSYTTYSPPHDYTPPQYITLVFSNLSIMTPAGVSDELIKIQKQLLHNG